MGIGQEPSSGDIDTSDQDSDADTAAGDMITNDDTMSEDELELELAGKPWPVASRSDVIHSSILSIVASWIMTTILIFYKWNSSDFWHFGILSPKCFSEQARQGHWIIYYWCKFWHLPSQQHISIEQTSSEKLEEFQFVSKDRLKWFYSQLALFKTFNFQTLFAVMNNIYF